MTVYLSQLSGSGAPSPASTILLQGTQTSATNTVTVAIPAGTYSVVADYPMLITINSVPFFIPGGSTPTNMTTTASATSAVLTNLSIGGNLKAVTTPASNFTGIAWSSTLNLFAATVIGSTATFYTSPDGITWTVRTAPATSAWVGIAWNGTSFCAIGNTSGTTAATSTDGITWTLRTLPGTGTWSSIAWNGTVFCAIASQSGTMAATSPDGTTWTLRTLPATTTWAQILWNGTQFLATSGTTSWGTSPDGTTWTSRTGPAVVSSSAPWYNVAWGNGMYLYTTGTNSNWFTSTDGITWTTKAPPSQMVQYAPSYYLGSVVFINGVFIMGPANNSFGTYNPAINYLLVTTDGTNAFVKQISNPGLNTSPAVANTAIAVYANAYVAPLAPNPFAIYAQPAATY